MKQDETILSEVNIVRSPDYQFFLYRDWKYRRKFYKFHEDKDDKDMTQGPLARFLAELLQHLEKIYKIWELQSYKAFFIIFCSPIINRLLFDSHIQTLSLTQCKLIVQFLTNCRLDFAWPVFSASDLQFHWFYGSNSWIIQGQK